MTFRATPPLLCVFILGALSAEIGCSNNAQPALTDEDKAGEAFVAGAKVKAALGNKKKKQNGTVLGLYGKLVQIKFADHNIGWVPTKEVEPAGAVQRHPEGDKCAFSVEDRVRAPWSTSKSLFAGVIDEVHGKMAHVKFDDGDADWADCEKMKAPKEKAPDKSSGASSGGSSGGSSNASDAVAKCKSSCNKSCRGASNKSKCVGTCRRACG